MPEHADRASYRAYCLQSIQNMGGTYKAIRVEDPPPDRHPILVHVLNRAVATDRTTSYWEFLTEDNACQALEPIKDGLARGIPDYAIAERLAGIIRIVNCGLKQPWFLGGEL